MFLLPHEPPFVASGEPKGPCRLARNERSPMKGSEKPKRLGKKKAQKTLKERRADKRAAATSSRRDIAR